MNFVNRSLVAGHFRPPGGSLILSLNPDESEGSPKLVPGLIALYLAIWFIVGLSALLVGTMIKPDISSTLSELGTGWLGLAVASTYAYFGLDPTPKK